MFNTKKSTSADEPKREIPKVADVAPRIASEIEPKILELGTEKAALIAEQRELAVAETPSGDFLDQDRELRVAEILGKVPPKPRPTRSARMTEIVQRVRDIDDALDILRRERETERNRAGAIIRERVAPEYKALVAELCRALVGAHRANALYWQLIETLQDDGVSTGSLGDHRAGFMSSPRDTNSQLAIFLRECGRDGLFPSKEIPPELLP